MLGVPCGFYPNPSPTLEPEVTDDEANEYRPRGRAFPGAARARDRGRFACGAGADPSGSDAAARGPDAAASGAGAATRGSDHAASGYDSSSRAGAREADPEHDDAGSPARGAQEALGDEGVVDREHAHVREPDGPRGHLAVEGQLRLGVQRNAPRRKSPVPDDGKAVLRAVDLGLGSGEAAVPAGLVRRDVSLIVRLLRYVRE